MAGTENLIPNNLRSRDEIIKNSRKGGIKSGETRRKKRDLKAKMKTLLELPVIDDDSIKALENMGIDEIDNAMLMLVGLFKSAVNGDVNAVKEIRNIIGDERRTSLEIAEIKAKTALAVANTDRISNKDIDDISECGVVEMPAVEYNNEQSEVVLDE